MSSKMKTQQRLWTLCSKTIFILTLACPLEHTNLVATHQLVMVETCAKYYENQIKNEEAMKVVHG